MRPVVKPLVAAAVALVAATACSAAQGGAQDTTPSTVVAAESEPTATTAAAAESESDGVLTIGVLLPQTGEGATIGIPGIAAANLAVGEINEAGGVLGEDVRLISVDEGQTSEQAEAAIDELLTSDVDAIVGPASSLVALEFLDELVNAGVVTCSPAATSMALDDFPDNGLFFRTVPSDSFAAVAIGGQAKRTGVSTATVVFADDAFGRPFARAVINDLRSRDIDVLDEVPVSANASDYSEAVDLLASADATGTIIVLADSNAGWNFLTQLSAVLPSPPKIIVNDALRRPPAAEIVAQLPEPFRTAIDGFSPLAVIESGAEPTGAYAPQAYSCVNLVALAAVAADTDVPASIAEGIGSIANEGSECSSFGECAADLDEDLDVNYDGPGGLVLDLATNGDPDRARFQVFQFDSNGIDQGAASGNVTA